MTATQTAELDDVILDNLMARLRDGKTLAEAVEHVTSGLVQLADAHQPGAANPTAVEAHVRRLALGLADVMTSYAG